MTTELCQQFTTRTKINVDDSCPLFGGTLYFLSFKHKGHHLLYKTNLIYLFLISVTVFPKGFQCMFQHGILRFQSGYPG